MAAARQGTLLGDVRLVILSVVAVAGPVTAGAQGAPAACVRIAIGAWTPPLDWTRAGHADSVGKSAARQRHARDSVFAGEASVAGRDEMQWWESNGRRGLLLYPSWWPAGVEITFDSAAGDTLRGGAVALVADARTPVSRAPARVLGGGCPAR